MDRFLPVLLEVWREACRHIEIRDSVATLAPLLARHLPISSLLVRRFDVQHQSVDTVAIGQITSRDRTTAVRTILSPPRWKKLIAWADRGQVLRSADEPRSGEA